MPPGQVVHFAGDLSFSLPPSRFMQDDCDSLYEYYAISLVKIPTTSFHKSDKDHILMGKFVLILSRNYVLEYIVSQYGL